jgi:hypothetical protein
MSKNVVVALSGDTPDSTSHSIVRYMDTSLDKLVDDILIQVLQTLSVHAILALRKVSHHATNYPVINRV